MSTIPTDTHFVLAADLDTIPTGARGKLTRLDSYHIVLAFEDYHDLVFDVQDTDPALWSAIKPTVNPSMTDPPCRGLCVTLVSVFITALIATALLCFVEHGVVITFVCLFALAYLRDVSLKLIFTT